MKFWILLSCLALLAACASDRDQTLPRSLPGEAGDIPLETPESGSWNASVGTFYGTTR